MRKSVSLLMMFGSLFILVSCREPGKVEIPKPTAEETVAAYYGTYDVAQSEWIGASVGPYDLNNDGEMLSPHEEFLGLVAFEEEPLRFPNPFKAVVYADKPDKNGNYNGSFDLLLPIQDISEGNGDWIVGRGLIRPCYVSFRVNGNAEAFFDDMESGQSNTGMCDYDNCSIHFESAEPGKLTLVISHPVYDFKTGSLIDNASFKVVMNRITEELLY